MQCSAGKNDCWFAHELPAQGYYQQYDPRFSRAALIGSFEMTGSRGFADEAQQAGSDYRNQQQHADPLLTPAAAGQPPQAV